MFSKLTSDEGQSSASDPFSSEQANETKSDSSTLLTKIEALCVWPPPNQSCISSMPTVFQSLRDLSIFFTDSPGAYHKIYS